jgi:hypothetical protein
MILNHVVEYRQGAGEQSTNWLNDIGGDAEKRRAEHGQPSRIEILGAKKSGPARPKRHEWNLIKVKSFWRHRGALPAA